MTITRRLAALALVLSTAMTVLSPSLAGASTSASVTPYDHVGLSAPVAISAHGKYLWIADPRGGSANGQVLRVNASTGAHLSITSPLIVYPRALVSDGTYVWVVNGAHVGSPHGFISRINIATSKVTLVTRLNSTSSFDISLALAGPYLWASGLTQSGSLLRINRSTLSANTLTSPLFYGSAALCADQSYLWIARDLGGPLGRASLTRLSLTTGAITGVNSPYFNDPVTVTSNGTYVWMPASNHVVVKVDIATNKVTKISSKSFVASLSVGSSSHYVYVASVSGNPRPNSRYHGAVTQVGVSSNSINIITSKHLTSPEALAVLGPNVWVINSSSPPSGPTTKNLLVRITP